MKSLLKISILMFLLINSPSHAANPILGWYGGIILGGSYSPAFDFYYDLTNTTIDTTTLTKSRLAYSGFGDIGGLVGYRWERFRAEGEFIYNYNPYEKFQLGNLIIRSPTTSTDYRIEGSTSTGAAFLNAYFDMYQPDCPPDFIPYIGVGAGYAYVNNSVKFFYNNLDVINTDVSVNTSTPVGQAIAGISYFLDDFTVFSLDYRYLVTAKQVRYILPNILTTDGTTIEGFLDTQQTFTSRMQVHSINLTFSGSFQCIF